MKLFRIPARVEQELTLICSINEVRPVISERIGADVT
jgi:hypothetical protein